MQEFKRLIDDVIGQLRAGFDEVVHRQQAEAARAQKKYDQDIASLQKQHGEEIAQLKMKDLNAASLEAATDMIKGTARSMGIVVE